MPDRDALSLVAAAILDGTPIDWETAQANATDAQQGLLDELRVLSMVAEVAGAPPDVARWGRLRIIRRVGSGSWGDVYRAWDPRLDREIALKLMPAGSAAQADAIILEGKLLARVRHQGVAAIYDAERIGAHVGLCMEFIEGDTVAARIARDGPLPPPQAIDAVRQVCAALAAVHDAGVLHRDVKAANVIIRPDGRAVLMDFGAGAHLGAPAPGERPGTPLYVAPEVLAGKDGSVQADIYSAGVLLYFMLTGTYPVQGATLAELRAAHAQPRSSDVFLRAAIPSFLAPILARALSADPARRFDSAAGLEAALRAAVPPVPAVRRLGAVAAAVLVAAAVAAGGFMSRSAWPTPNPQAHALYIRGRIALDTFSPDGTRLARQLFEQALALDADYAQPYTGLAEVYLQMNAAIPNLSRAESLRRATDAANRALALDDSLAEAHVAAAGVRSARADWPGAEREYRRAIQLAPRSPQVRQQYAQWLSLLGRFDEGLDHARVAEALDPLSPRAILAVASVLRFARRFDEAIASSRAALQIDPNASAAFLNLGHCYQGLGRLDLAIEAFERVGRPTGNLGHVYALAGRTADARALIAQFEERYARSGLGAGDIAQIYAGLGEIDRAFEWLERMDTYQPAWPATFKVAAVWDPLRSDPRFPVLLKKYGLAD